MMPSIARRPLLSSVRRPFCFFSADAPLLHLRGSYRLRPT